ncbi:MAG TPA: YihY/virulence factor BrkB family protein [Gemmatimonadaceae bacterium]|nr:YihY/virulence factor BrkB family protein [Gemmatimonadaceae bacterium]
MRAARVARAGARARGGRTEGPLAVVADYAHRLWDKGGRDDLFFLAGGVAFSILLAGVPFFLLLASGLGYALNQSADVSSTAAAAFVQNLFPATLSGDGSVLDPVLHEVVRTRGAAGVLGAVAFVWFSTRLFGSMRSVLVHVFEVSHGRGIVWGKLFDIVLTVAATALVVTWIALSAYIALARSNGVELLSDWGLHAEGVMGPLTYVVGRIVAFVLLSSLFFTLYKLLPNRKVRWQQAAIGGLTSAVLFELARSAFTFVVHHYNPASLYTGTLAAVIVVVFWVYYAALIFVLGGEVSQVHEDRRADRGRAEA